MDNTTKPSRISKRTMTLMAAAGATVAAAASIGIGTASASGAEETARKGTAVGEEIQFVQPVSASFSVREFLIEYIPGADLIMGTPEVLVDWGDCPACGMG